jgi:hypothetical protein
MQFDDPRVYVVLALGLLVGTLLISLKVENSRFGSKRSVKGACR